MKPIYFFHVAIKSLWTIFTAISSTGKAYPDIFVPQTQVSVVNRQDRFDLVLDSCTSLGTIDALYPT